MKKLRCKSAHFFQVKTENKNFFAVLGIVLALFFYLFFMWLGTATAQAQSCPWPRTDQWQVYDCDYGTMIIKPSCRGCYITRSQLEANRGYLNSRGWPMDANFVWYSDQTSFQIASYPSYSWSYLWPPPTYNLVYWIRLGEPGGEFYNGVWINAFRYGDSFISQVCGNYTSHIINPAPPKVSGYKWDDRDGDGSWDAGESALSGWEVHLYRGSKYLGAAWTNASGYYEFTINANWGADFFPNATFTVHEVARSGWAQTNGDGKSVYISEGVGNANRNFSNNNFGNHDIAPPTVTNVKPSGTILSRSTWVSADYSDGGTGINSSSATLALDGIALTDCIVTSANISCPVSGLIYGTTHAISGSVSDNSGNSAPISGSFNVTGTPSFCVIPFNGLIDWWPGDGNADNRKDGPGTLMNGTGFAPGMVSSAFVFDGSNDYVENVPGAITSLTNNFTVEFWAYPTATHEIDPENNSTTHGTSGQRYAVWPSHGGFVGSGYAGAGISVGTNGISVYEHAGGYMPPLLVYSAPINGWHHVALVYTNRQPKLYLDGQLVRTGLTGPMANVYPSRQFGGGSYGYYQGRLDEFSIYNRSLTPNEINAIASSQCNGKCKDDLPPVVENVLPSGAIHSSLAKISADYYDPEISSGINNSSLSLLLDGVQMDLTGCSVGSNHVECPDVFVFSGHHVITGSISDNMGNSSPIEGSFDVVLCSGEQPGLVLSKSFDRWPAGSGWETYADYLYRRLTVDFRIGNNVGIVDAYNIMIIGTQNTNGVATLTELPVSAGDVPAGSSTKFSLLYSVPPGVNGFLSTIYAQTADVCGNNYYYPGPFPTS